MVPITIDFTIGLQQDVVLFLIHLMSKSIRTLAWLKTINHKTIEEVDFKQLRFLWALEITSADVLMQQFLGGKRNHETIDFTIYEA